jgi:protein-tyrosine kinase
MSAIAPEHAFRIEEPGRGPGSGAERIGEILARTGKLAAQDIKRVLDLQQRTGLRFGKAALRLRLIAEEDLSLALARQYDAPYLEPGSEVGSRELVTVHAPFHPRAEEMRTLRTQVMQRWASAGIALRRVAIVSPERGEGRSYVAANLAVAFAQLGERTLLIDADLRNPRLHRMFALSDRTGLSAVLCGRAGRDSMQVVPGLGSLWLLPAGAPPPNPLELLSRHALGPFLQAVGPDFDVIVFDTPPARLQADAQCVALQAGGAIVLARKEHSRIDDTRGVIRDLTNAGAPVLGTVLNAF